MISTSSPPEVAPTWREALRRAPLAPRGGRRRRRSVRLPNQALSAATHELNTPLAGLRGCVQLMVRRLERQGSMAPEQLHEELELIGYQAERLGRILALVLDGTRLYTGEFALQRTLVDLVPLVERQLALTRTGTGRPVRLVWGPASLWTRVDPQRFEHLLGNLLDNAVKYSPSGAPIEVELRAEAGQARLTVTDHGIGISAEQHERVFEAFHQIEPGAVSAGMVGMGLGLFMSRQIVHLHGGTIALEAPAAGGTRVVVTLPLDTAHANGPEPGAHAAPAAPRPAPAR